MGQGGHGEVAVTVVLVLEATVLVDTVCLERLLGHNMLPIVPVELAATGVTVGRGQHLGPLTWLHQLWFHHMLLDCDHHDMARTLAILHGPCPFQNLFLCLCLPCPL